MRKLRKRVSIFVFLVIIIVGGYFSYKGLKKTGDTISYVTAAVKKGTLIVLVEGSGQISALDQIEVKSKVASDVLSVKVVSGQEVKEKDILITLDSSDAYKAIEDAQRSVEDAEIALESANSSLEKVKSPADESTIFQAESALTQAKDSLTKLKLSQETSYQKALQAKQKAIDNIAKGYEDSFNTIESVFFNIPTIMTSLRDILYDDTINEDQLNIGAYQNYTIKYGDRDLMLPFITSAENDYSAALAKYTPNLANYKSTNRYAEQSVIDALLTETLATTKAVAQTVKSEKNLIDYVLDYISLKGMREPNIITTYQSDLKTYLTQANSYYSSLLACQQTIQNNKDALVNAVQDLTQMDQSHPLDLAAAERSIKEKEDKLADLLEPPDPLDIQSAENTIKQRELSLASAKDKLSDAREKLVDYIIRAPYEGTVAQVNVKKNDSVSSGKALLTLITKEKLAEISLNEVDAVKLKLDQKVTFTFDAIEGLTLTGKVIEIDTLGTVTQGVVTYGVKMSIDTQDERVKSGMSVNTAIITDAKQNVLMVSNAAIKLQEDSYYVEIIDPASGSPQRSIVKIGLVNDLFTEIISGLKEGDQVVTTTVTASSASSQQQPAQKQMFQMPGMGIKIR